MCAYCENWNGNGNYDLIEVDNELFNEEQQRVFIDLHGCPTIEVENVFEGVTTSCSAVEVNFCPMCGRKL